MNRSAFVSVEHASDSTGGEGEVLVRLFRARTGVFLALAFAIPSLAFLTGSTASVASSTAEHRHVILIPEADKFVPYHLTVEVGDRVTWINNDTIPHTATSDSRAFDSGNMAPGASFSMTFPTAGTSTYHCTLHPGMIGTVNVQ